MFYVYCLVTLLTKHFENAIPLIIMTVCQFLLISIGELWARLYRLAYLPRKVLLSMETSGTGIDEKIEAGRIGLRLVRWYIY